MNDNAMENHVLEVQSNADEVNRARLLYGQIAMTGGQEIM